MTGTEEQGTVASELLGWEPISERAEQHRCSKAHLLPALPPDAAGSQTSGCFLLQEGPRGGPSL